MSELGNHVQTLIAFDQAISWPDTHRVTDNAISFVKSNFDFDRVSISLINTKKSFLDIYTNDTSVLGLSQGDRIPITVPQRVILTSNTEPQYVSNLEIITALNPIEQLLLGAGVKSFFIIPLIVGDDVVGSLNIDSRDIDGISSDHQDILTLLSARLSLALLHARLHDTLKEKEKALEDSERGYRELIDQAGDIILRGTAQGNLIQANRTASRLLGYSNEELLSMNFSDLFDPEILARKPLRYDLIQEGQTIIAERVFITKDGRRIPIEMNSKKLSDGTLVSIIRDLTERTATNEQLLDQKNQISALFDAIPAPLYAKNNRGHYIMLNDAYLEFFGKTRDEMLGKTTSEVWSNKKAFDIEHSDQTLLKKNESPIYSREITNASGELRQVEFRRARYHDAHGNVAGFVGTIIDYTDLRAAEERYQTLFKNSPDPIVVHDGQIILAANQAAIDFFKTDNLDQYIGSPISDVIHPDSYEDSKSRLQELFSSRQPNDLSHQKLIISTGEVRDIEVMAAPITLDGRLLVVTSFRDITDELKVQKELSISEQRYRRAFDFSPTPMILHDAGTLIDANQAALEFAGVDSLEDVLGHDLFSFVHKDFVQSTKDRMIQVIKTDRPTPVREQIYLTITGEERWVEARGFPVHQDGKMLLMVSFNDIHDRVMARQLVEESRQQLELVTRHVTNFIFLIDLDLSVLYVNHATADWLGHTSEKLVGMSLKELAPADALEAAKQYLPRLQKGEACGYLQHYSSNTEGELDFWVILIPVMDDNNELLAYMVQMENITEREAARKELAENKELLELIIDTIPGFFSYSDMNQNYLYVNKAYARWYGKEKEDLIGQPMKDILSPAGYRLFKQSSKKLSLGEEQQLAWQAPDKSGENRLFDLRYIPHLDKNKKMKAFLTSLQDVTDQRMAEKRQQALQDLAYSLTKATGLNEVGAVSANTLRSVFESDAITIELYDHDRGLILGIYSEDTFEGQSDPQPVPVNEIPFSTTTRYNTRFKAQCLNRTPAQLEEYKDTVPFGDSRPSHSLLFVPLRREGTTVGVVSVQSYTDNKYEKKDLPLLQSFADQIGGALVRAQKDAQIRAHQTALEKEEKKYRSIIENAGDAVFVTTIKGQILTANEHACTTLGYTEAELMAFNLNVVDQNLFEQLNRKALSSLKADGAFLTIESVHTRKNGASFPVELRVGVTEIEGKPSLLCFARDITDRKLSEKRELALRTLSHDLNESSNMYSVAELAAQSIRDFFESDAFSIEYFDFENNMIQGIYTEDTFVGHKKPRPVTPTDTSISALKPDFFERNSIAHVRNRTPKELETFKTVRPFGSNRPSHSLMFAPIVWTGKAIGVLTVQSYTTNKYTEADIPTIQTFADQVGSALLRAKKDEELTAKKNELQESELKYRSIIENAGDAVFVVSLKGEVLAFNQNATESLGYSEAELLKLNLKSFSPELRKSLSKKRLKHLAKEKQSITLETNHTRKDGSSFPVEIRVGTMELNGIQSILFFARDVSDRKEDEFFRGALRRLARRLTVSLNPRQVGIIASSVLYDLFKYDAFALYRINFEENIALGLFAQDTFEGDEKPVEVEQGITSLDLLNHKSVFVIQSPVLVNRAENESEASLEQFGNTTRRSKSLVFVPIFWEGVQIGLFSLQSYTVNKFSEADTAKLKVFANQIGGALVRAQTDAVLQAQTSELQERERELKTSVKEKDVLLKEVYHRTKNNMQVIVGLLEMQGFKTRSQEMQAVIKEMTNRIYSMSMVHDLLYRSKNLSEIKLDVYLKNLIERLVIAYKTTLGDVNLHCNAQPTPITIQVAIPLGLVINEIVSNALKYAFPKNRNGQIIVDTDPFGENGLVIKIRDNGVGFNEGFSIETSDTLGIRIVKDIIELQLFGELVITSDGGVEYYITIPDIDLD